MARLSWLHFSDILMGPRGSRLLQPEYRDALEQDLRKQHARSGPWDLVLISGDLTQAGTTQEFELLNSALSSLWTFFRSLGSNPFLLTVPGTHDLMGSKVSRGRSKGPFWQASDVRAALRGTTTPVHPQQVRAGFAPFSEWSEIWRKTHPSLALTLFREGLLPGDFTAAFEKEHLKVGVVGLNSVFRDDTRIHEVHLHQVASPSGAGIQQWAREQDVLLLVTHHGPSRLSPRPFQQLLEALRPSDNGFILHLCGGQSGVTYLQWENPTALRAPSLFGKEGAEDQSQPGLWGYGAGYVDPTATSKRGRLKLFSRIASPTKAGLVLMPDGRLPSDEQEAIVTSPPSAQHLGPTAQRPHPALETHMDSSADIELHVGARQVPDLPPGVKPWQALETRREVVGWMAWAPSGEALAVGMSSGHLVYWEPGEQQPRWTIRAHRTGIQDLSFEPTGQRLASRSQVHVRLWSMEGTEVPMRKPFKEHGLTVAWSSLGLLAADTPQGDVLVWKAETEQTVEVAPPRSYPLWIYCMAWSPDGRRLACGGGEDEGTLHLWSLDADNLASGTVGRMALEFQRVGARGSILDIAWKPSSSLVALACRDATVRIWNAQKSEPVTVIEGHTASVVGVSFSSDGRLLASKALDGTVRLFRTDTWGQVARIEEPANPQTFAGVAFSPTKPVLATLAPGGRGVRVWDIDVEALLRAPAPSPTVQAISAKVVLVGEGRAGKSCLALRMVEDRYEELGSTHAMKFWPMPVEAKDPGQGTRNEVILWDMGGQEEYRLVHQLFLRDSTVALMVMEPGRGQTALEELEGWNRRLLEQTGGRPVRKLLVGTKVDSEHAPVDEGALQQFVQRHQFADHVLLTSAKEGRGIPELKSALVRAVDWAALERVSRPELFQRLRERIQRLREARKVVITFTDLETELNREARDAVDPEALRAVVAQLARQGLLADTRMADGTRALILEVEQVERYAGSLILLARDNPHGVPALDLSKVHSPTMQFPRIRPEERLSRDQELIVLECVTQLLLEHGLCLEHEGMLIFPSLFRPTQPDAAPDLPHAVSLHYDFAGPIDNIYASLVSSLATSQGFGPMRLWEDRAEFGRAGESTVGMRRVRERGKVARGLARLDVYFDSETPKDKRELFVSFVERHLAEHGVELMEQLVITCVCGKTFPQEDVLARMEMGKTDILCPVCEHRTPITLGAQKAREQTPELAQKTLGLRTKVQQKRSQTITETKIILTESRKLAPTQETPLRILHLSDLHIGAKDSPDTLLQPLVADLKDPDDGLGLERLDYLVISGDITNRATPEEFEQATRFVSALIQRFGVTSERCIIVPGNHDLHWGTDVYTLKKKWQLHEKELVEGRYHQEGNVYFLRDEAKYPERFRNFSQHFYHPLLQKEYPLSADQQCLPFLFREARLQFLAMNSAWEIDEYFQNRSSIDPSALSRGLDEADRQLEEARKAGRLALDAKVLRLAVWHHPITNNEKMQNDAFMGRLLQANVRACLHGHVHEDRADQVRQPHSDRRLHVIGAGSFGAPTADRPEAVPRLYNLLEVSRDLSNLRVHTRCMRKEGGAWQGWAAWKGPEKGLMQTYYDVPLT